jgi:outer membrane lipoprotein-sorting protein
MKLMLLVLFIPLHLYADAKVDKILDRMDKLYRSDQSTAYMTMKIVTPHWQRSMKLRSWTKGLEKTFIVIDYPRKDKGVTTLKKGNEMWNYFPKINKVIKVPPSMMMGSWMGSDFTNDDLVKENTKKNDYTSKIIKETETEYEIELLPKKETVTVWGKIILKVEKKRTLPLAEDYYDEKGKLVRTMTFSKIEKVDGKEIPMKMVLIPLTKEGNQTVVEYTKIDFNTKINDSFFSKKNLQKRR